MSDFYSLKAADIDGNDVDFSRYKGNVCMVVNLASYCGYTPQYTSLQKMYEENRDNGLSILGFPCNQFAKEEPGTDDEIKAFCSDKYNVTFDLFSKIEVKGKNKSPVYEFLTGKNNPWGEHEVRWNFQKYIVGKDGNILSTFDPKVEPDDKMVTDSVKEALE